MENFATSSDADYMSGQIIGRVAKYADKYNKNKLEVGMSLPGIVDYALGKVLYIPYFKWRDWDIGRQIERQTGLAVTMDNDANAIALAELWFGEEKIRKIKNFITVLVAEGVGTGIVFDGQVYRGEKGAAGEFGHMIVGENAPVLCSCGSRNCWEAHSSEKAIAARYRNLLNGDFSGSNNINIDQIINLAVNGDEQAIFVLKETAKFLGIGISNLIVGFSPQAVVVSGRITKAWHLIAEEVHSVVEHSIRRRLPMTVIKASSLGENPTIIGSLSLVLARIFASAS
ncbi:MAG: ROK family protein [Pyrinomonadaceae bacterium]|nr:ROK family protein [Pyrinomonadaceae bacterium]